MKRLVFFVLFFLLLCFCIPLVFVNTKECNANDVEIINVVEENYDYKDYGTIKLLHTDTNEIEELGLDEYLYGVVAAEMPANYELEALKAQAIVARTYTIYNIKNCSKHDSGIICDNSSCCQAWISKEKRFERWEESEREGNWDKIVESVNTTKGKIITYNGEVIDAFFHANSGGKTESVAEVWGGERLSIFASCCNFTEKIAIINMNQKLVIQKKNF